MPPLRPARAALCALLAALLLASPPPARAADAVVGTGSPASCTKVALDTALTAASGSGGGTITFSCGAAPHTILLSAPKPISADIALSGEGGITLSGNNATALFQVFSGYSLTLNGVSLTRAFGAYGAIENFGRVSITGGGLLTHLPARSSTPPGAQAAPPATSAAWRARRARPATSARWRCARTTSQARCTCRWCGGNGIGLQRTERVGRRLNAERILT
jgi:hypothetical protein